MNLSVLSRTVRSLSRYVRKRNGQYGQYGQLFRVGRLRRACAYARTAPAFVELSVPSKRAKRSSLFDEGRRR